MPKYLTRDELMKLSHLERREYTQSIHNNTMRNLNRINRIADDEIAMINQIVNQLVISQQVDKRLSTCNSDYSLGVIPIITNTNKENT